MGRPWSPPHCRSGPSRPPSPVDRNTTGPRPEKAGRRQPWTDLSGLDTGVTSFAVDWLGWLVIAFVCFWMLVITLVILRTGLFMLLLAWAGLRQWRDFRNPSGTDGGADRDHDRTSRLEPGR